MPTPVIVLAVLAVSVVAATLLDLARHDVRMLPKWAWGLIILVAFPFGVIVYLVMGRSRRGDNPPGDDSIVAWRVDTSGATDRPAARPGVRPAGPPVILAKGLSKWYGTAIALDRIDLQITRGSTYGLIGPKPSCPRYAWPPRRHEMGACSVSFRAGGCTMAAEAGPWSSFHWWRRSRTLN